MDWNISILSNKPEDITLRFLEKLKNDSNPKRHKYRINFHRTIVPKKEILPEKLIIEINETWNRIFGEIPVWEIPSKKRNTKKRSNRELNEKKRVKEWRAFRYNKKKNPKEKWHTGPKGMGNLYHWTSRLKYNKYAMQRIAKYLKEEELNELSKEGFKII